MGLRLLLISILTITFQTACSATKFAGDEGSLASKSLGVDDPALDSADDSLDSPEQEVEDEEETETPEVAAMNDEICAKFRADALLMQVLPTYSGDHIRSNVKVAATALSLEDVRGTVDARSQAADLFNLRGRVCLLGIAAGAQAQVGDHRGRLDITGMVVSSIDKTRGTLVIRDGEVKSITDHRGVIRLINSKVGSLSNHRGQIILEGNSTIASQSNSKLN